MKKYLQITFVLGSFFLLVFIKNYKEGNTENSSLVKAPIANIPIPTDTIVPTQSTSLTQPSVSNAPVAPIATPTPRPKGKYKNGTYTGSVEDAYYGNVQVQAIISGSKLTDIGFLQYPNDNGTSQYINSQALPLLKQEAIAAQSANVDLISGASESSPAFERSLATALQQAK